MPIKLNLGSGARDKDGFISIDNDPHWIPYILRDLTRGIPFRDYSVDEIYSENFLEHLDPDDAIFIIQEIQRVLKFGCIATIIAPIGIVPDLSHKSFYHPYTFENLFAQDYRYKLKGLKVKEKSIFHHEKPFDYDELKVILEKIEYGIGEPK